MDGWEAWQRQTAEGAVESEQRAAFRAPVVAFSIIGAQHLGCSYWREVERVTFRLVRTRLRNGSLELRLFGNGPVLLRLGRSTLEATAQLVSCRYPIEGGLLARRAAGEIVFAQVGGSPLVVCSAIRGFFPRFAGREGGPDWSGVVYNRVQSRIHVAISRRYFARLSAEASR